METATLAPNRQFHGGHRSSQHLAALRDLWRWEKSLPRHGTLWRWRFGKVRAVAAVRVGWASFQNFIAFILQLIYHFKEHIRRANQEHLPTKRFRMHLDRYFPRWSHHPDFVWFCWKNAKATNRRTGWVFCLANSEVWWPDRTGPLVPSCWILAFSVCPPVILDGYKTDMIRSCKRKQCEGAHKTGVKKPFQLLII